MGNPPPDYYQVLDIPRDSSPQQIRTAYKLLAKKWHPDKHPLSSKADAEAKFKAITQAYEVLNGHEYRAGSGTPARKKETPVPKHGGTAPANGFKDFSHLKTMNFAYARTPARDFRTPGRDFKDFYYPTAGMAEKPRPGAFMSHSGPLRRKPPPEERKLECTLEELCYGCKKEIRFARDVIEKNGMVVKKQESHTIRVKPGWKKGTKISFEGLGDERPGFLPADIVFYISEKEHPTFKRDGNDLVVKAEVPLVNALTGWTFSFQHLNGDKMTCIFDNEIIHPGYEKVIEGQGMSITGEKGTKGDLRIKLQIVFPTQLSLAQRSELAKILRN